MALYEGWRRRRHGELYGLALATRAAHSTEEGAIDKALPPPKPLIGGPKDEYDRSRWW